MQDGDVDFGSLMAGQSVGLVDKVQPMQQMFDEIINEAEEELERIYERLGCEIEKL